MTDLIDARKRLRFEFMQQFRDTASNTLLVQVEHKDGIAEEFTYDMTEDGIYKAFNFQNDSAIHHAIDNDDNVYLCNDDHILQIYGIDVIWYQKRRFKKLMNNEANESTEKSTKSKTTDSANQFIVWTAVQTQDGSLKNVESFTGSRKDMVARINKQLMLNAIRESDCKSVFKIATSNDVESEIWHTIDELIEMGVVK